MSAEKCATTGGGGRGPDGSPTGGADDDKSSPAKAKPLTSLADARPPTLGRLRALNRERWRTVELLHSRLNDGDDGDDVDRPEDPLELHASYLRAELRLLREREDVRSRGEVARRMGDALSRPAEIHGIEIAETHGALVQVNAALDRSIGVEGGDGGGGRLGERTRAMEGYAAQHRAVHSALLRMLGDADDDGGGGAEEGGVTAVTTTDAAAGDSSARQQRRQSASSPPPDDEDDELERRWVLGEFEYLASILDAEDRHRREWQKGEAEAMGEQADGGESGGPNGAVGDPVVAMGPLAAASRKRRRPNARGGDVVAAASSQPPAPPSPPSESVVPMSGVMGPLLGRLARRFVCHHFRGDGDGGDDETDPYISLRRRGRGPGGDEDDGAAAAEASVARLLVESGVAETHPDDDTLVRLVDLLG